PPTVDPGRAGPGGVSSDMPAIGAARTLLIGSPRPAGPRSQTRLAVRLRPALRPRDVLPLARPQSADSPRGALRRASAAAARLARPQLADSPRGALRRASAAAARLARPQFADSPRGAPRPASAAPPRLALPRPARPSPSAPATTPPPP